MSSRKIKKRPQKGSFCVWKAARLYLRDVASSLLPQHKLLIEGHIRARNYAELAGIRTSLGFAYLDPFPNQVLFQIEAFFKKNTAFADKQKCLEAARENFFLAEDLCRQTNNRLREFYKNESSFLEGSSEHSILLQVNRMRSYLCKLFGSLETFLDHVPVAGKVTSGATSTRPRKTSQPYRKIGKCTPVTPGTLPLLRAFLDYSGINAESWGAKVVNCNRVTVVPKSWKTDRSIAAEPEGNLFFQLAVDDYLKGRLKRRGIDLLDQSRNQQLAELGSLTGSVATVDLSMASDTMSLELIPFLLPLEWSQFLLRLRSPRYKGTFGSGEWEKFSSMGNGFTFPLESAIFWAAAKAVRSDTVSVFGDDIIIDSEKFDELRQLLLFLGFSVNTEKTFHKGPFRESCGADFWKGVNVRPFFVKESGLLGNSRLCHIVNGLIGITYEGGALVGYLLEIVSKARLPVVPWNESSTSGVHALPWLCYRKKLLHRSRNKRKPNTLYFRGYVTKERDRTVANLKTLLLWFLEKQRSPQAAVITSVVGLGQSYVMYGPSVWRMPTQDPPDHLYWWSGLLTPH